MTDARDVSELLRLREWPVMLILALFTVSNLFYTVANLDAVRSPAVAVLTLLLVTAGAVVVAQPARDPFPAVPTVAVLTVVVLVSFASWNLPATGWPGWASWFWFGTTALLMFLVLRGRGPAAWIGFGLHAAITMGWALSTGRSWADGIGFVIRHAGLLLVISLLALLLRRTLVTLGEFRAAELQRAQHRAEAAAVIRTRDARMAIVRELAYEELEHLASHRPISDADRDRFLWAESSVRDILRGGTIVDRTVLDAARRARQRSVRVMILDDSHGADLDPSDRERVLAQSIAALDAATTGEVTIRRLPPGRSSIATIRVADGEEVSRIQVAEGARQG